jgi:hypothetical protein
MRPQQDVVDEGSQTMLRADQIALAEGLVHRVR